MRRRTAVLLVGAVVAVVVVAAAAVAIAWALRAPAGTTPSATGSRPLASGGSSSPLPSGDATPPFPDATSTGVPAGTSLKHSGDLNVTTDGAVISGLDVDGCVDVHANHVTIQDSRITCSRPTTAVRLFDGYTGLTVQDTEIDGSGVVSSAVGFSNFTLLRVNIHDVVDGPRLGDDTAIVDSYVHDLVRTDDSHNDTVQVTGGSHILVRHNTLEAYDEASGDLFNSAIQVGSTSAAVSDLVIEGNYLDGGNYTVNFRADLDGTGIVGRDNTFGPHHRYGPLAHGDLPGIDWSGEPLDDQG